MVMARHSRPKNTGQPQHKLALDRGLSVIVCNDRGFERSVIFGVLEHTDHRLGREPMTNGVAAGMLFAFLGARPGTFLNIAPVGVHLLERSH
jgi:hypothetical protein